MTGMVEATRKAAPKILIADDDPAVVSLLSAQCTKMGFAVEIATNGLQLLMKARQNHPDAMIIDVNMPELDGISACVRILEFGNRPFDVVVITANQDPELAERCEALGLFYGNKRFEFWKSIEAALLEIFPDMADRIIGLQVQPKTMVPQARPRILLVDDDAAIQHFLASKLGKYGVEMLYASDANHGYRIAARAQPSVIITDYYMPNGDGKYLLTRLRSTPATAAIPVIVLSGNQLDPLVEQDLRREISGHHGAAHVLRKSLVTDELFNVVKKYCSFG